ncbi:hypothetical protein Taro_056167 [Colocasia esculenta]|uniref:Uncharacterized protein n=1 Tax=Colocasia esculenta TaxID=4460 RepID=A0A843XWG5_COLES|nr:hypothetical protein [Colocasia esculenta]
MSENFELRVQRLENIVSAKFIEQKAASDHAAQRFNRLIGTLADASVELKEHQEKLEIVLKGILANSQADVFNTKETLSQISKTRLSFAHFVDELEGMKNLSAHIDEEMSALKKEFKGQHFLAKVVSTQPSVVDTTPSQVDTRWLSQGTILPSLGQCVDTPYGQVDTLRKRFHLRLLLDTWHPREMMDQSWILCPRTPRVSLGYLGYKYPPIRHPSKKNLLRASRNWFWWQEEFISLLLLSWCFLKPFLICSSMRSGD